MQNTSHSRYATLCVAAALLAGCAGSKPPIGAQGAMPQSRAIAQQGGRAASGPYGDLLYVSGGPTNKVYVFTFPDGKLVQTLTGFDNPTAECSDGAGNVWIGDNTGLYEYAHGGTTSIAMLHGAVGGGCAEDPLTGNIAATNEDAVLVWTPGSGNPTTYTFPWQRLEYCGYDNSGNLFIDLHDDGATLLELPYGNATLQALYLSKHIASPGQVQWDGSSMTIANENKPFAVYRFQASGSSATVVGSTKLKGITKHAALSWIAENSVVVPFGNRRGGAKMIGFWDYPSGGKPTQILDSFGFSRSFQAATVSLAPRR